MASCLNFYFLSSVTWCLKHHKHHHIKSNVSHMLQCEHWRWHQVRSSFLSLTNVQSYLWNNDRRGSTLHVCVWCRNLCTWPSHLHCHTTDHVTSRYCSWWKSRKSWKWKIKLSLSLTETVCVYVHVHLVMAEDSEFYGSADQGTAVRWCCKLLALL